MNLEKWKHSEVKNEADKCAAQMYEYCWLNDYTLSEALSAGFKKGAEWAWEQMKKGGSDGNKKMGSSQI